MLVAVGSIVMLLSSLGIVYGFQGHAWMAYPCAALVGVGFRVRQRGRQLAGAKNVTELADSTDLVVPQEPFILYLRGFDVDPRTRDMVPHGPLTVLGMPKLGEEELLVRALSEVAPVLAIGDPTDRLPQLGAQRIYYRRRDSGWKRIAGELIHRASLVVITTGDSDGLDWEYAHVLADLPLERLLIVVCGDGHHYERFRLRARLRGQFPHSELPEWPTMLSLYDRRTIRAAVRFDTAGTPSLEPLVFQTGWSHRSALETSLPGGSSTVGAQNWQTVRLGRPAASGRVISRIPRMLPVAPRRPCRSTCRTRVPVPSLRCPPWSVDSTGSSRPTRTAWSSRMAVRRRDV
ncbi:hypothetical protein [Streptomyces sp. NPDC048196]|uniref:hypothetical protein n=1 Tax=Streptomyces sp. NPDC048196 TaxID=3154712 RepID=UPI0033C39363